MNNNQGRKLSVFLDPSYNTDINVMQFAIDNTMPKSFKESSVFLQQIVKGKIQNDGIKESGAGSTFKKERKSTYENKETVPNYKFIMGKGSKHSTLKTVHQENNSKYLLLIGTGTHFEARFVNNWYKVQKFQEFDVNEIEEAEINMNKNKQIHKDQVAKNVKIQEKIIVKELTFDKSDSDLSETELNEKKVLKNNKKLKYLKKMGYGTKEIVNEDSDKDDHQGDEVDYMSNSDDDKLSEDELNNLEEEIHQLGELEQLDKSDDEIEKKKDKKKIESDKENDNKSEDSNEESNDDDSDDDSDSDSSIVQQQTNKRIKLDVSVRDRIVTEIRKLLAGKAHTGKEIFKHLIKKNILKNDEPSKEKITDAFMSFKSYEENHVRFYKL